jgi:Holliday junction DNA helicase RuvB
MRNNEVVHNETGTSRGRSVATISTPNIGHKRAERSEKKLLPHESSADGKRKRQRPRKAVNAPTTPTHVGDKSKPQTAPHTAIPASGDTAPATALERHPVRQRIVTAGTVSKDDEAFNQSLRPPTLAEYVGQKKLVQKLEIALQAAKRRKEPLEHTLFHGPPGLGKTTLAYIIAHTMKAKIVTTSGPALERTGDLMGILTNLGEGAILFIDEIHRLPVNIEEFLYPAMEDFKVDIVIDKGMFAKTINMPLKKFTLVGATTRAGSLSAPLRNRFGLSYHLDFYDTEELHDIILRSARILGARVRGDGATEIARRSRGTPRIANRLLRRVRDYAEVKGKRDITAAVARDALELEGVDEFGFDDLDRSYFKVIIEHYGGGPVGVEALSATLNEEVDTLVDMVEPFLLQQGFISRTRSGRKATERTYRILKLRPSEGLQSELAISGPDELN